MKVPKGKLFLRITLTIFLLAAAMVSFWFAAPTAALEIDITSSSTAFYGGSFPFQVTVTIEDLELLPV